MRFLTRLDHVLVATSITTSCHMEKTYAGLQMPLYPRNITEVGFSTTQNNNTMQYNTMCRYVGRQTRREADTFVIYRSQ